MKNAISFEAIQSLRQLGEHLTIARKRRRWTQQEIQARTGLTRVTISKIESGDASVSMGNYLRVMSLYGGAARIGELMYPEDDLIGLDYGDTLPTRIRHKKPRLDNDF